MSQQATEAEILADRQKRTAALRAEFWKQVTNPYRHATGEGGHIVRFPLLHHNVFIIFPMFCYQQPLTQFFFFFNSLILPFNVIFPLDRRNMTTSKEIG